MGFRSNRSCFQATCVAVMTEWVCANMPCFVFCWVLLKPLWIPATRTMITLTFNFFLFQLCALCRIEGHYRHDLVYCIAHKVQYIWNLNATIWHCSGRIPQWLQLKSQLEFMKKVLNSFTCAPKRNNLSLVTMLRLFVLLTRDWYLIAIATSAEC